MKALSGRAFARLVERRGWRLLWVNGSHHIYVKSGSDVHLSIPTLSIPIHGNRPLKIGLLRHLANLAEISDDDLQWPPPAAMPATMASGAGIKPGEAVPRRSMPLAASKRSMLPESRAARSPR
jgi:predicted RNA binding protein YcfA (HicA-like mRNA interferase family)